MKAIIAASGIQTMPPVEAYAWGLLMGGMIVLCIVVIVRISKKI